MFGNVFLLVFVFCWCSCGR